MIINGYNLRSALKKDIETLASISVGSHVYSLSRLDIEKNLKKSNVVCIVAEEKEFVLGYIMYKILKNHFEIIDVVVKEEFRLASVGSSLIDYIKAQTAKSFNKKEIRATVSDDNLGCHLFFKSRGFTGKLQRNYFKEYMQDGYLMTYVSEV